MKNRNYDLGLAVFDTIREPGRRYSYREIATATGCSRSLVFLIEKRALAKLKRAFERLNRA